MRKNSLDKFKELKLTVGQVMKLKKGHPNYKDLFDKISMNEIEDIFQIIDRYSGHPTVIERNLKGFINDLLK